MARGEKKRKASKRCGDEYVLGFADHTVFQESETKRKARSKRYRDLASGKRECVMVRVALT